MKRNCSRVRSSTHRPQGSSWSHNVPSCWGSCCFLLPHLFPWSSFCCHTFDERTVGSRTWRAASFLPGRSCRVACEVLEKGKRLLLMTWYFSLTGGADLGIRAIIDHVDRATSGVLWWRTDRRTSRTPLGTLRKTLGQTEPGLGRGKARHGRDGQAFALLESGVVTRPPPILRCGPPRATNGKSKGAGGSKPRERKPATATWKSP